MPRFRNRKKFNRRLKKHRRRRVFRRRHMKKGDNFQRQLLIADRSFVKLRYIETTTPFMGGAAVTNETFFIYNLNSAFDLNASLGNTATPGFSEWGNFYKRYRVHAVKVVFECVNANNFGTYMFVHLQPSSAPSGFGTFATLREFEGNRYSKFRLLSESGAMNKGKLTIFARLAHLFGGRITYLADNDYTGLTGGTLVGSNPAIILHGYVGMLSGDGNSNMTANSPVRITIQQYIEFYDRTDLIS